MHGGVLPRSGLCIALGARDGTCGGTLASFAELGLCAHSAIGERRQRRLEPIPLSALEVVVSVQTGSRSLRHAQITHTHTHTHTYTHNQNKQYL